MSSNNSFIIAAYAIFWVGILAYLVRLRFARSEARRRLESVSSSAGSKA
jgi:CcmD family protein